jgi:hypothetical protein
LWTATTLKPTDDNLNKYATFSYLPNAAIDMHSEKFNTGSKYMVIQQINDKMIDAGYIKIDRTKYDLLILVSTKEISRQTVTDTDPVHGYYNRLTR